MWLHGGPGSGSTVNSRSNFSPAAYRAVLFDQRGCGRSRPLANGPEADLSSNTTAHLIDDIERLREHLGVQRWVGPECPGASLLASPTRNNIPMRSVRWCSAP